MALDMFQPYLFVSAGEQSNKYLTPVISPNGIAGFQAQRAQSLTGLTVRIDPIQEGSGDPSPTNVRAISGRTGLKVTRANKNLAPNMAGTATNTTNGITFTYNDDGSVTLNGTATANAYSRALDGVALGIYLPHGTYKKPVMQIDASHTVGLYVQYVRSASDWVNVTGGGFGSTTFTIDEDYPIVIRVAVQNGTTVNNVRFEPYVYTDAVNDLTWVSPGKTNYSVTWETEAGAVYGGTLDVVSGVLTVDRLFAEFAEDKYTLTYNSAYTNTYGYGNNELGELITPNTGTEVTKALCNMLPSIARNVASSTPGIFQYHGQNNQVRLTFPRESAYDAPSKIYALGVTAVIPLKEPIAVYQLTPEDVKTLAGFNQIYSDAGPVIDIKF